MSAGSTVPLLSIVTVTRNDSSGLARTLQSLTDQEIDWSLIEHLVIDGDSTDDTEKIFARGATPVSRFVSEPDRGVFDAMNKGLLLARGRYLQYLNSGDRLASAKSLAQLCNALGSSPVWLVAGAVDEHGGLRSPSRIENIPHSWWRHALGVQPHCHQTSIMSKNLLLALGGHNEAFGFVADYDVVLRAGLIQQPAVLDEVIVRYEGGGMSAQRQEEIPAAIAQIRADRFALNGVAAKVNRALATWQRTRIRIGRRLGR